MKHAYVLRLLALCALAAVLVGCSEDSPVAHLEPTLVSGELRTELLTVETENYDRANNTGLGRFLETESGYYYISATSLYYADKNDMNNWVPVCSDPDCRHSDSSNCTANIWGVSVFFKDERIWFITQVSDYPHLYTDNNGADTFMLCSMAQDGSDVQLEHIFEDSLVSGSGAISGTALSDGYAFSLTRLNKDGSYVGELYIMDDDCGEIVLHDLPVENYASVGTLPASFQLGIRGDDAIVAMLKDKTLKGSVCWFHEGELVNTDISDITVTGAYLSENVLRCYEPNDGYYDIDLLTGEQKRLDDAQLKNSSARILAPNCIIESTLLKSLNTSLREMVQSHAMRFFDGQQWHDVVLPEELRSLPDNHYLAIAALTSDCVMFIAEIDRETCFYRMALDAEEYKLEHCGTFNAA